MQEMDSGVPNSSITGKKNVMWMVSLAIISGQNVEG